MTEKSKTIVKSSTTLTKFNPKKRKELVIRGLTALDEVRDADFYLFKGEEHAIRGEYEDAIKDYEKAIELDPEKANYYFRLGLAEYYIEGHVYWGTDSFKKAIELNPEVADYHYYFGRAQYYIDEEDAIEAYKKAIELDPNIADYYYYLGVAQEYLGGCQLDDSGILLYESAIDNCKKAIELDPKDADYYYTLGQAQYELSLYEDAVENFKEAIKANPVENFGRDKWTLPRNAWYYSGLGDAQYKLSLYKDAVESFKKSMELSSGDNEIYIYTNLAECYKKMGIEHLELECLDKVNSLKEEKDRLREVRRANKNH